MTVLTFSALLFIISYFAGVLGALTGLGGGVIVTPALVLLFHINIYYAMGASLISVIATSSGTAAAYLREGYTNLRIGLFLESGAVIGAFVGALLIAIIPKVLLISIFSLVLFFSAYLTIKRREEQEETHSSHPWAIALNMEGEYPTQEGKKHYYVQKVPLALFIMTIAGLLSGLLGIGSGALKVLAMDQALRLPYKVATTTSNFMIGITAAVSAGIYFSHGFIDPGIAFPVMMGVILGSYSGAKILPKIHHRLLRIIFSVAVCLMGLQMLYKAFFGGI